MGKIKSKISNLNLLLPGKIKLIAAYAPSMQVGNFELTSRQIPILGEELIPKGLLSQVVEAGGNKTPERKSTLNAVVDIKRGISDFDGKSNLIKVIGNDTSIPTSLEAPEVLNGSNQLLLEILEDEIRHPRLITGESTVPVNELVENELLVELTK